MSRFFRRLHEVMRLPNEHWPQCSGAGQSPFRQQQEEFLTALGNSAGPRAGAIFIDVLKDEQEELRTSAARGLRLTPGDAVDLLLASTARDDTNAIVRGSALLAISFRLPLNNTLWDAV